MGEAKRRRQNDSSWGKEKQAYLTDTYNLFRIEERDDFTWLITNLALEEKGFKNFPTDWTEAIEQRLLMTIGASNPSKSCWVVVDEQCKPGDIVLGKLSHHPIQSIKKGFPTLTIEKFIA